MEDAAKLGEMLKLPNLEEETIKLINERMRLLIGDIKPMTPAQQQYFQTVMDEYFNGPNQKVGEQ